MSKPLRLYFNNFSINQAFSPIKGEQKAARQKLLDWALEVRPQLINTKLCRPKSFPMGIYIKYYTCKESFDINMYCLITYQLLKLLEQTLIIQSINNNVIDAVAYDVQLVKSPSDEGCSIVFITD